MKRGLHVRFMVCPPKFSSAHNAPAARASVEVKKEKGRGAGDSAGRSPDWAPVRDAEFPSLPFPPPPGLPGGIPPPPRAGNNAAPGTPAPHWSSTHHPGQCPVAAGSSAAAAARLGHGWCLRSQAPRPRPPLPPPCRPPGPSAPHRPLRSPCS